MADATWSLERGPKEKLPLFPNAVPHDPAIDTWFQASDHEPRRVAHPWFVCMRGCGADVRELLQDGHPTACVADAPFAYVAAFSAHVNIGFFHGAGLVDPAGLLEGAGKRMRRVKLRWGQGADETALAALITAAYQDIRLRLGAKTGDTRPRPSDPGST